MMGKDYLAGCSLVLMTNFAGVLPAFNEEA